MKEQFLPKGNNLIQIFFSNKLTRNSKSFRGEGLQRDCEHAQL